MLKKKLAKMAANAPVTTNIAEEDVNNSTIPKTSHLFNTSLWQNVFKLESQLNEKLRLLKPDSQITHIYNPLEYAVQLHCQYLRKFLKGTKKLLFIGMNPGHDGMGQTGVPFGNISTVKTIMGLCGTVDKPPKIHPKRPIKGLESIREEPSGKRLWTLFKKLSNDSLEIFFEQCFVYNFCPLAFFNKDGKNITPSELKGPYKQQIRDTCFETTEQILKLIKPEIIVAVGCYVHETLRNSEYCKSKRLLLLPHPSPRSLNNNNWPEKAENFLFKEDLIKYLKNDVNTT